MSFDIDTRPLRGAAAALRDSRAVDDAAQRFVERLGPDALQAVKMRARRHRRTGDLEAGMRLVQTGAGVDTRARVVADSDHAGVVLRGSVAHIIRARHGRPMPFARGGAQSFAFSVKHPGTKADPILEGALEDLTGPIDAGLSVAGDRLADGLGDELKRRI